MPLFSETWTKDNVRIPHLDGILLIIISEESEGLG